MARSWDVFCRVIDNHGDLGVAWRLCADLANRGQRVRLWVDDPSALAWMAPDGLADVEIVLWTDPAPDLEPSAVVVETFGCDPPASFVRRMAGLDPAPCWVNLEYLSAEHYAERSHGLPSPVSVTPVHVLTKRFHFPGFTPASGGLLREPSLLGAQRNFDRSAWFAARGIAPRVGERVASLFCYANTALPALLEVLSSEPTLLLATPGAPAAQVQALLGASLQRGALRVSLLPYLTQKDYDYLLWACDLNLVRGEDSFVRAQWAARPFLWQVYPQADDAHVRKLQAFLERFLAGAEVPLAGALRRAFRAWNGIDPGPLALPDLQGWRCHCGAWRDSLAVQPDLVTRLLRLVEETR
jgi:uncharacterized repeat protein (TIGR03837 family)